VTGLRIDHVDGLRDPAAYLHLLDQAAGDTYIIVEKILESDEMMPGDWAVEGTTGYDFAVRASALFVDPDGEAPLTDIYAGFAGGPERPPERGGSADYEEAVYENKHLVMREVLAADVRRIVNDLVWVCQRHRQHRDHTRLDLSRAVREILAGLDVYRTYVRAGPSLPSAGDVARVEAAVARAIERRRDIDPSLFEFLRDLLLKRISGPQESEFALRFQQLSGPVMAKGVEDTTFYQFNRLVSLNEVGGNPGKFGTSVEEFHEANARMARDWPGTLLASSTHDTKRSEDVRARISLLSEIPQAWGAAVERWAAMNARHKADGMPDANAEYLLYQVLVGAHPLDEDRAVAFMEKASREAKQHTSWIDPDPVYDEALAAFVKAVVADDAFTADLAAFTEPLVAAGRQASLAQMLLKLTSPGVPDIYQGTELWDLSLVDPDNRRPVDYDARRALLAKVKGASAEVLGASDDGAPKLWLTQRVLDVRQRLEDCFAGGSYEPLAGAGRRAGNVVAYIRGGRVAVIVPRLVMGLSEGWGDTMVTLPEGRWTDELGGSTADEGRVSLAALLSGFPVALLVRN